MHAAPAPAPADAAVVAAFEEASTSGRRRYADDGDGDGALGSFAESGMPLALQDYTSLLEALVIPLAAAHSAGQGPGGDAAAGTDVGCYCRMAARLLDCFRHLNDPRMKVRKADTR